MTACKLSAVLLVPGITKITFNCILVLFLMSVTLTYIDCSCTFCNFIFLSDYSDDDDEAEDPDYVMDIASFSDSDSDHPDYVLNSFSDSDSDSDHGSDKSVIIPPFVERMSHAGMYGN